MWPTVAQISGPKCWTDDWPSVSRAETAPSWTILPACPSLSQLEWSLIATAACLRWLVYGTVLCDIVLYIMFQSNRPWCSVAGNWSMLWCLCPDGPLACVQIYQYSSSVVPLKTPGPPTQWPLYYSTLSSKQWWLLSTVLAILEQWAASQGLNQRIWCETDLSAPRCRLRSSTNPYNPCHAIFFYFNPGQTPSLRTTSLQEFVLGTAWKEKYRLPLISLSSVGGFVKALLSQLRPKTLTGLLFSSACASLPTNLAWTDQRTVQLPLKHEQWFGRSEDGSSVRVFSDSWRRCRA